MLIFQRVVTDLSTVRVAVHASDIVAVEQDGCDQGGAVKFRSLLVLRSGVKISVADYFDEVVTRVEEAKSRLESGVEK